MNASFSLRWGGIDFKLKSTIHSKPSLSSGKLNPSILFCMRRDSIVNAISSHTANVPKLPESSVPSDICNRFRGKQQLLARKNVGRHPLLR